MLKATDLILALVVIFTHLATFALITTVLCWVYSGPNTNGETANCTSGSFLPPPVGMYERDPRMDIGVHRLSAPLLCLRMRGLCQQHLKPDRKLSHISLQTESSLLFEASVVLGVLGWDL